MRRFFNSYTPLTTSAFLTSTSAFGFFQYRDASSKAGKTAKTQDSWEKTVDSLITQTKKYTRKPRMQKTDPNYETASQLLLELENLKPNNNAIILKRNQQLWKQKINSLMERAEVYMNDKRTRKTDPNYETASWLLSELKSLKLDPARAREFSSLVDQRLYNSNHNSWREKDFNSGFDNLDFILREAYQLGHFFTHENSPCKKSRTPGF